LIAQTRSQVASRHGSASARARARHAVGAAACARTIISVERIDAADHHAIRSLRGEHCRQPVSRAAADLEDRGHTVTGNELSKASLTPAYAWRS